jgi:GNAT superfamily N-acetyltransferase
VRRRYGGLGLARLSMQVFMECAADEGVQEVLLVVDTTNQPAITLYRGMGFAVADDGPWTAWFERVHRQYGVEETVMRLPL